MKPEKNSPFAKRIKRHVVGRKRDYFAVTFPGFERLCETELKQMGMDKADLKPQKGGVEFSGKFIDAMAANLHLRCAGRVLMRMDDFSATHFRKLEKKIRAMAWELYFYPDVNLKIHVTTKNSRLYHKAAISDCIIKNIHDRITNPGEPAPHDRDQHIFVRVIDDRFQISLDTSGDNLFKRGIKIKGARAPVRETMAAGILRMAGFKPGMALMDPMCGSGTFSMEAAMITKTMAPGLFRDFSFMNWPAFNPKQWKYLKKQAQTRIQDQKAATIFASDKDKRVCKNIEKAIADKNMDDSVKVFPSDFFTLRPKDLTKEKGLVVLNPPYGLRIGSRKETAGLFQEILNKLTLDYKGWQVALLSPERKFVEKADFKKKLMPISHGGLKLVLMMGKIG